MIKINLAKMKQASYASGTEKSGTMTSLKALGASADSSEIVGILSRVLLPLALCGLAYFAFNYYIDLKTEELNVEAANIEKEKDKIQNELKKIRGFEDQKNQIERASTMMANKISTIEKLILGKDHTVKAMIALSQALPKDVWITEIVATENSFSIRGGTVDMALVGDVMAKLDTSIYYKDVSLKGSTADPTGRQASFELSARRE